MECRRRSSTSRYGATISRRRVTVEGRSRSMTSRREATAERRRRSTTSRRRATAERRRRSKTSRRGVSAEHHYQTGPVGGEGQQSAGDGKQKKSKCKRESVKEYIFNYPVNLGACNAFARPNGALFHRKMGFGPTISDIPK